MPFFNWTTKLLIALSHIFRKNAFQALQTHDEVVWAKILNPCDKKKLSELARNAFVSKPRKPTITTVKREKCNCIRYTHGP